MILTAPEHAPLLHICQHMRAIDREEIFGLRNHDNPFLIVNDVMARPEFSWVAWHDGWPVAVIGGVEVWPGRWRMHCFGTDDFHRIGLPLTRFIKRTMLPAMWRLDARRLEADSLWSHTDAHRWMEACGMTLESVKRSFGRNGDDYFCYVIVANVADVVQPDDATATEATP